MAVVRRRLEICTCPERARLRKFPKKASILRPTLRRPVRYRGVGKGRGHSLEGASHPSCPLPPQEVDTPGPVACQIDSQRHATTEQAFLLLTSRPIERKRASSSGNAPRRAMLAGAWGRGAIFLIWPFFKRGTTDSYLYQLGWPVSATSARARAFEHDDKRQGSCT